MKWLQAVLELSKGNQPPCPNCGKHDLDYGYIISDQKIRWDLALSGASIAITLFLYLVPI